MKKWLSCKLGFALAAIVILSLGIVVIGHGAARVSIAPAEIPSPAVGEQLRVDIHITDGRGVAGYELSVVFDAASLRYLEATNADYLPTGALTVAQLHEKNNVYLTAISQSGPGTANDGTLATMTFEVVAINASTLKLSDVTLWDSNSKPLEVTTVDGKIVALPAWDVNQDGEVNTQDLALVRNNLRTSAPNPPRADVNGDGTVNILDLALVEKHLGESTGMTSSAAETAPEGMVLIPAGEFEMGSDDKSAYSDERPSHPVYVDAFYMDTHEVTNAQYRAFVLANPAWQKGNVPRKYHNGYYLHLWNGNEYPSAKAEHPVVYVSWYAAMAYADWVGKRLPTEAEWEKAQRGGVSVNVNVNVNVNGNQYPWGNDIDTSMANYGWAIGDTAAVGSYAPNGYGLYDMAGNVWEWCLDAYQRNFYLTSPLKNPISGAETTGQVIDNYTDIRSYRVLRGGSWSSSSQHLRVSYRFRLAPSVAISDFGFRCAKSVSP